MTEVASINALEVELAVEVDSAQVLVSFGWFRDLNPRSKLESRLEPGFDEDFPEGFSQA
jgi:hypothetical protein